jgi:hypothetical protein
MPFILPSPDIGFNIFGLNLVGYLPQPGSGWTVNRYGFDTGRRRFLANKDVVDGDPFVVGTPDFLYPEMFVDRVTSNLLGTGPWVEVDVEYLGLIHPKEPAFSTDTDVRHVEFAPGNIFFNTPTLLEVALTTVQVVYVTDAEPDLSQAGTPKAPPLAVPDFSLNDWERYYGLAPGTIPIQQIWVLERRAMRMAGRPGAGYARQYTDMLTGTPTINLADMTGVGTRFLIELSPGNIVYPFPYKVHYTMQGGAIVPGPVTIEHATVLSVQNNTHATLVNSSVGLYTGGVRVVGAPPSLGVIPGIVLYEVTDSYKRVLILGLGQVLIS